MTTCSSRLPEGEQEHHCSHEQGHLLDHKCNCGFVWAEEPYLPPSLGQRVIGFAETLPGVGTLSAGQRRIMLALFDSGATP